MEHGKGASQGRQQGQQPPRDRRSQPRGGRGGHRRGRRGGGAQNGREGQYQNLNALADVGNVRDMEALFAGMAQCQTNTVARNILIKGYGRGGQPAKGYQLLLDMVNRQQDPQGKGPLPAASESSFTAVVKAFAENNDLNSAWRILHWQRAMGHPTLKSFKAILRSTPPAQVLSVVQMSLVELQLGLTNEIMDTGIATILGKGDANFELAEAFVYFCRCNFTSLQAKGATLMISAYAKTGMTQKALQFFTESLEYGLIPDMKVATAVVNLYVSQNPPFMEKATQMIDYMNSTYSIAPDVVMLNEMIKGYGRCTPPQVDKSMEIFQQILTSRSLSPTSYTFSAIVNALCSVGKVEEAEELVRKMPEYNITPLAIHYNILLKGYSKCRCKLLNGFCKCKICMCSNPERSMELLHEMEKLGLLCDAVSLLSLVESFCSAAMVDEAMSVVQNVMLNPSNPEALRPTTSVFNVLLRGVCLKYAVPVGDSQDVKACGSGISNLEQADPAQESSAFATMSIILKEMKSCGLKQDVVTNNTVITILCAFGHVERGLSEVGKYSDGPSQASNTRIGYNTVLNGLRSRLWPKYDQISAVVTFINDVLEKMSSNGVEPDTISLNTVVKVLVERNEVAKAEAMVDDMHAKYGVSPNSTTFSSIVLAHKANGALAEAKRVMQKGETRYNTWLIPATRQSILDQLGNGKTTPPPSNKKKESGKGTDSEPGCCDDEHSPQIHVGDEPASTSCLEENR